MKNRILLVDDIADCRLVVREMLSSKFPSAHIDEASSGQVASLRLKTTDYQLVISDSQMENGTGLWLYRFMRDHVPNVPLLIFTADPDSFRGEPDSTLKAIVRKDDFSRLMFEVEKVRH